MNFFVVVNYGSMSYESLNNYLKILLKGSYQNLPETITVLEKFSILS